MFPYDWYIRVKPGYEAATIADINGVMVARGTDPYNPILSWDLAKSYHVHGFISKADEEFRRFLRLAPNSEIAKGVRNGTIQTQR